MQIAELFVSLGVKNSDKTVSALTQVQTSLGKVASTSLEAKAAIIGAMYALEHLMSESASRGTALSNFNAYTGISIKQLQQWQYAARQARESNEEFAGSIKSVQEKIALMKMNQGQPAGLAQLSTWTGGFDVKKSYDEKNGLAYVLQKSIELTKTKLSKDVQNQILKSFGWSEGTIGAMRKGVFNEENYRRAPIFEDAEVNKLNKIDIAWSNLNNKIQMFIGHLNAKHGLTLINDVDKLTTNILKLVDAFITLSEKLKLFEKIDNIFKGWSTIFTTISLFVDKINAKDKNQENKIDKEINKNPLVQFYRNPFNPFSNDNNKTNNKDNKVLDNAIKQMNDTNYIKELGNYLLDFLLGRQAGAEELSPQQKNNSSQPVSAFLNSDNKTNSISNIHNDNKNNPISYVNYLTTNNYYMSDSKNIITPKVTPPTNVSSNTQNTTINQNLNFQHEGKDIHQTKDSLKKAIGHTWKQLSAQSQGT